MAALSKCCRAKLIETTFIDCNYCSGCGLMYFKIKKKLKPDEIIDEWE